MRLISPINTCFSLAAAIARICSTIYKNPSTLRPQYPALSEIYIVIEQASLRVANVSSRLKSQSSADFAELIAFVGEFFVFQMFEVFLFLPQGGLIRKTKSS